MTTKIRTKFKIYTREKYVEQGSGTYAVLGYHHSFGIGRAMYTDFTHVSYIDWLDATVFDILEMRYRDINDCDVRYMIRAELQKLLALKARTKAIYDCNITCDETNNSAAVISQRALVLCATTKFYATTFMMRSFYVISPTAYIDTVLVPTLAKYARHIKDLPPLKGVIK